MSTVSCQITLNILQALVGTPAAEKWCGSLQPKLFDPWICASIEISFAQQAQLPTEDL